MFAALAVAMCATVVSTSFRCENTKTKATELEGKAQSVVTSREAIAHRLTMDIDHSAAHASSGAEASSSPCVHTGCDGGRACQPAWCPRVGRAHSCLALLHLFTPPFPALACGWRPQDR